MALPSLQTRQIVLESLGVSVVDFRCQAHVEPLGPEEPNATHGIVLVRRGVFRRKRQGETVVGDANHVLFINAGEPYRYAHPLPGGDECTVLVVDRDRALDLVSRHAPADAERPEAPFRLGHGLASPRAARLHYELIALLRRGVRSLELDDVVADLADEAVAAAYRTDGIEARRRASSVSTGRRRRDLAEAAKLAVNDRIESLPSLGELARELGCSPFHLSRTFHRATGVSLRDYVRRLRARRAADRLAGGARDLAGLAVELGYADHSHFTNAFREEWGLPPSRFRERQGSASGPPRNDLQASGPSEA